MPAWSNSAEDDTLQVPPQPQAPVTDLPAPVPVPVPVPAPHNWLTRWFDPATSPFIPVPEIAVDPDSGTTLGLLMVTLKTNPQHEITRIMAPDVLYNPYFGVGAHARVYAYPSPDEQWSLVGGVKQRVEREFDAEYETGRSRDRRWSISGSVIYDRSGTPRFYGIGNNTPKSAETNYTDQQEVAQVQVGLNLSHAWQLLYTGRVHVVDVLPGTLARIATLESRFGPIPGVGTTREVLNRFSVVYDTRDDLTVPRQGTKWVAYGGMASRNGILDASLYSEAGVDGRAFWPLAADTVLAAHMALRYLPTVHRLPFWALSGIGGGESVIGGEQPLRGYGAGRYYDRDSFSASVELRKTVTTFNVVATHLDLELAPFVDVGRVFARASTFPLQQLHTVGGVGFRGIARPFVVGYVDIGYGSEGVAVFTGINYPF
ncbi:MAG: putative Surface antigen [Gammaproteobacteria bacterium]|nr:putative Surface antigen [Gammaproteobacteria bacterium]